MFKRWEIKEAPTTYSPSRKKLLFIASDVKLDLFKKQFIFHHGAILKQGKFYQCYLYNLTSEVLGKLEAFFQEGKIPDEEKFQQEGFINVNNREREDIYKTEKTVDEQKGKLEEDKIKEEGPQSLIPKFEKQIEQNKPKLRTVKKPKVAYIYPAGKKKFLVQVEDSIKEIINEKNLKYEFEKVLEIEQDVKITADEMVEKVKQSGADVVIMIAPKEDRHKIASLLRSLKIPLQTITEENIDKKFRYLNLITDIALLSPYKR